MIRPADANALAAAVRAATARGVAIMPRGGGLSYTGGYASPTPCSIVVDLSAMDRILHISREDMVITVQAGITWKQIYDTLAPLGLRLPFFGTFSGAGATVGGGLSHGALFFGSARYGSAAEIVLGMEVVLADGSLLRTGQGALSAGRGDFIRTFGPDLTGLFTHDGGMFGVKTQASFRLIEAPHHTRFGSFAFAQFADAADALSAIARADLAEEVYVLDPSAAIQPSEANLRTIARAVRSAAGAARSLPGSARALLELARGGRNFIPPNHYSLHFTAAGRSAAAVNSDVTSARRIARRANGKAIAATIPRITRAKPFYDLNGVLDPDGRRWAALNAKVPHSQAGTLVTKFEALIAAHQADMAAHGVSLTKLASALSNHAFSFEPVFHWRDSWLPIHLEKVDPALLASFEPAEPNPEARAFVALLRERTVELFREMGAASNQIGRTYPFRPALSAAPEALLAGIKRLTDPRSLMNPGVLGF
ncbi:MAG: FAD-binding oxidoreductase [Tsuneonella sp.]